MTNRRNAKTRVAELAICFTDGHAYDQLRLIAKDKDKKKLSYSKVVDGVTSFELVAEYTAQCRSTSYFDRVADKKGEMKLQLCHPFLAILTELKDRTADMRLYLSISATMSSLKRVQFKPQITSIDLLNLRTSDGDLVVGEDFDTLARKLSSYDVYLSSWCPDFDPTV